MACSSVQLDTVPMGMCSASWVLRDGGAVFHNGEEVARAKEVPQEGDIVVSEVEGGGIECLECVKGELWQEVGRPSAGQEFPAAWLIQVSLLCSEWM